MSFARYILFIAILGFFICISAKEEKSMPAQSQRLATGDNALFNANRIAGWLYEDGKSGVAPDGNSGIYYQRGFPGVTYTDGLVWGGYIDDGNLPDLRVGGQTYRTGTAAGRVLAGGIGEDPDAPDVRLYKIRSNFMTLTHEDLLEEAVEYFMLNDIWDVTEEQTAELLAQYRNDWNEWPTEKGAPFFDQNNNGVYEPVVDDSGNVSFEGDYPGLADADQVLWLVCNDLDAARTLNLYGSPPIGLELQLTVWSYGESSTGLADGAFRRYKLINKSGFDITDMYISQWVDPDIGGFTDDFVGCDTLRNLSYGYNATESDPEFDTYGVAPSAAGYTLLQGPLVAGVAGQDINRNGIDDADDFGTLDFQSVGPGFINLPMTSFAFFAAGSPISDPVLGNYEGTLQWYNLLRGYVPNSYINDPVPYITGSGPMQGLPTHYPLSGDPINDPHGYLGDVDGVGLNFAAGDRRTVLSSGPFDLGPDEFQEIIIAVVGGTVFNDEPNDHLLSLEVLFQNVDNFHNHWNDIAVGINTTPETVPDGITLHQNYPNPFNPSTVINFQLAVRSVVDLNVYDINGRLVKRLLQSKQLAATHHNVSWDGRNEAGALVASGVYIYRLATDTGEAISRKMVLMK